MQATFNAVCFPELSRFHLCNVAILSVCSSLSECKIEHLCSFWHISASTTSATLHPNMLWFTSGLMKTNRLHISLHHLQPPRKTVRVIFWTSLLPERPSSHGSRESWTPLRPSLQLQGEYTDTTNANGVKHVKSTNRSKRVTDSQRHSHLPWHQW